MKFPLMILLAVTGCAEAHKEIAMNECTQAAATYNETIIQTLFYVHLCMELKGYDFVMTRDTVDFDLLESKHYQAY